MSSLSAAVSSTFAPVLATSTFSVANAGKTTKTFSLPPQMTPFVQPSSCRGSPTILCAMGAKEVTAGVVCNAFDFVTSTGALGVREECYPDGYSDIFYPQATAYSDVLSLAYPGTACISDWVQACTQTLTLAAGGTASSASATYTQTWCCPSGFQCDSGGGSRQCRSAISTANATVWDKPTSTLEKFEQTVVTGLSSDATIAAIRIAFPLTSPALVAVTPGPTSDSTSSTGSGVGGGGGAASPTGGSGGASSESAAPGSGSGEAEDEKHGLSTGAVAGVAVGCSIAGLALIGAAVFFFLRRRRAARGDDAAAASDSQSLPPPSYGDQYDEYQQQQQQHDPYGGGYEPGSPQSPSEMAQRGDGNPYHPHQQPGVRYHEAASPDTTAAASYPFHYGTGGGDKFDGYAAELPVANRQEMDGGQRVFTELPGTVRGAELPGTQRGAELA